MALALEYCVWFCLSCLNHTCCFILVASYGCSSNLLAVPLLSALKAPAWFGDPGCCMSGAQGMAVWLPACCGPTLRMLGQISSLPTGVSQLPEEISRLLVQRFTTETQWSRLLSPAFMNTVFLIIDCVKAKLVVFNLTCLGFAFKGTKG